MTPNIPQPVHGVGYRLYGVILVSSTGNPYIAGSIVPSDCICFISKDGGGFIGCTNFPVFYESPYFYIDITAAEATASFNQVFVSAIGPYPTTQIERAEVALQSVAAPTARPTDVWGMVNLILSKQLDSGFAINGTGYVNTPGHAFTPATPLANTIYSQALYNTDTGSGQGEAVFTP